MAPNEQHRTPAPDDEGWRRPEVTQEGEWNRFDVGYSDQHPDGSSSQVLRWTGGVTDDKREGYIDGVVGQNTTEDSSTELLGVEGSFNKDERTGEFGVVGGRVTQQDENGVESTRLEVLNLSAKGDLEGFSEFGVETKGTVLGAATDTAKVEIAKFQAGAFTGDGKTTVSGEANLISLGFRQGSGSNEAGVDFDLGIGGSVELYHGEDSDRDGYGEWGAKFPPILNKKLKEGLDNFTERVIGRPVDLSVTVRREPGHDIERLKEAFSERTGTPSKRISRITGSLEMRRVSEAYARLKSLL